MAPNLYSPNRRKPPSVKEAMTDSGWMKGLRRLDNEDGQISFMFIWKELKQLNYVNNVVQFHGIEFLGVQLIEHRCSLSIFLLVFSVMTSHDSRFSMKKAEHLPCS